MPLTAKGSKILAHMRKEYGKKRGTSVFYASANKGTIKGVHGVSRSRRRSKARKPRGRSRIHR